MDHDQRSNLLFVAGGFGGNGYVYDANTGAIMAEYLFADPAASFVNDVIVTRQAAYFTDSFLPQLYRVPLGPGGRLPQPATFESIPLSGDYVSLPGFNGNGIVASNDGRRLIVANTATAVLYLVDPSTGVATSIDLGGTAMTSADGLVLRGQKLYVVQNFLNQISVIALAPDWTSGSVTDLITSSLYRIPTTADIFGDVIYAVNARFDAAPPGVPGAPIIDYDIVGVKLP
jgi:hypothetical protein